MPTGKRIAWTPEMDALIGTDTDKAVGSKIGVHKSNIRRRRKTLGLPPCVGSFPCSMCGTEIISQYNFGYRGKVGSGKWCNKCRRDRNYHRTNEWRSKRKLAKQLNKIAEAIDKHEKKDS